MFNINVGILISMNKKSKLLGLKIICKSVFKIINIRFYITHNVNGLKLLRNMLQAIYRYVDDLSNFSDLDLRPYLLALPCKPRDMDWKWIYPMAPWGPLSMTDQTVRTKGLIEVIFLNMRFTLYKGFLSYCWYDKATTYEGMGFPICYYTHWGSSMSYNCKVGIITSQVRSVIIASSSLESCMDSLGKLLLKLESIGCPADLASKTVAISLKSFLPTLPVPFSNSWSAKA